MANGRKGEEGVELDSVSIPLSGNLDVISARSAIVDISHKPATYVYVRRVCSSCLLPARVLRSSQNEV